jgi:hypothetical protein
MASILVLFLILLNIFQTNEKFIPIEQSRESNTDQNFFINNDSPKKKFDYRSNNEL